jgi:hypothetical protein
MDSATLCRREEFKGSNLYASPPEESSLQLSTNNTALMDMIYGILGRDGPISPIFPTHVEQEPSKAKVMRWANSLSEHQSPVDKAPPPIYEYDHSLPRRTPSPMGSMLSESSSYDSSQGPKTPTFSSHAPPMIRRRFSYEEETNVPATPTRPPPPPPVLSVPPRSSSHNHTNSLPSPSSVPAMKATITSLVDDFMPEFLPSPEETTPAKPTRPTNLRISTNVLPYPVTPTQKYPELVLAPPLHPTLQIGQLVSPESVQSPNPVRSSAPVAESSKKLLRELNGNFSPAIRQSLGFPPNKSMVSKEGPRASVRHSMPPSPSKAVRFGIHPRPPVLSVVIKERPQISNAKPAKPLDASKTFDSRDRYRQRNSITPSPTTQKIMIEERPRIQVRHSVMLPASQPLQSDQQKPTPIRQSLPPPTRRTQQEIEAIPAPTPAKFEEPASFGTNLGIWFTKGFFAGEQGMQFVMSRRFVTTSKMEWAIEETDGSRLLKCFDQTNALSRRKDFFDLEGNQLFDFQRRTGSTRTAESPRGATLFVIKNASLHSESLYISRFRLALTSSQRLRTGLSALRARLIMLLPDG